jgi:segregation and condensation protein B
MDETEVKYVLEAALLAAGRPLTLDKLAELFTAKGSGFDRSVIKRSLDALAADYEGRGIELNEVASGYRIQVKRSMSTWLTPLWEERAPRYTRALLETLALIAYRQPITRGEIEEVRGVAVSTNIVRTLLERNWVRVVGHRDVPGKPAMFGTTRDFLDYFGLKRLEDLPALADVKDGFPELSPQTDLIESLHEDEAMREVGGVLIDLSVEHGTGLDAAQRHEPATGAAADAGFDSGAEAGAEAETKSTPQADVGLEIGADPENEIDPERGIGPDYDIGADGPIDPETDSDRETVNRQTGAPPEASASRGPRANIEREPDRGRGADADDDADMESDANVVALTRSE